MTALGDVEGLSEVIGRAIQEHLERSNINVAWPQIDNLVRPILRIEAFLEDAGPGNVSSPRSERVASVSVLAFLIRLLITVLGSQLCRAVTPLRSDETYINTEHMSAHSN